MSRSDWQDVSDAELDGVAGGDGEQGKIVFELVDSHISQSGVTPLQDAWMTHLRGPAYETLVG